MASSVESGGDGIGRLNPAWPTGTEPISQGDDHLRNIKLALQESFPGFGSYASTSDVVAVTGTPTDINYAVANMYEEIEDEDGDDEKFINHIGSETHENQISSTLEVAGNITAYSSLVAVSTDPDYSTDNEEEEGTGDGSLYELLEELTAALDTMTALTARVTSIEARLTAAGI